MNRDPVSPEEASFADFLALLFVIIFAIVILQALYG